MKMFSWKKEIRVSDEFGEEFVQLWKAFLANCFSANLIEQKDVDFDMKRFDFRIELEVISILSEGMSGTSLIGRKGIVSRIIEQAKEVDQRLISAIYHSKK